MKSKHRFRPSETWVLEDRIALSSGGGSAALVSPISLHGLRATFHGQFLTSLPTEPGASEQAGLSGQSSLPRIGTIRTAGSLTSNGSLAPGFSKTTGALTFQGRQAGGSMTIRLNGPATDLAPSQPTTTTFSYQVVGATGGFSPLAGGHGIAQLTLRTRPAHHRFPTPVAHGHFTLVLTEG